MWCGMRWRWVGGAGDREKEEEVVGEGRWKMCGMGWRG